MWCSACCGPRRAPHVHKRKGDESMKEFWFKARLVAVLARAILASLLVSYR